MCAIKKKQQQKTLVHSGMVEFDVPYALKSERNV